ncbi:hypothetical protein D3C72_1925310 [compost metagenome]
MSAGARDQVRGVKAFDIVAAPQHLGRHSAPLRQRNKSLDRIAHHILTIVDGAERAVEHAIVSVVRVDQADVALIPDPVRAANDVIDDIGVDLVETIQRLATRATDRGKLGIVAALHLQHLLHRLLALVLHCGFCHLGLILAHGISFHSIFWGLR